MGALLSSAAGTKVFGGGNRSDVQPGSVSTLLLWGHPHSSVIREPPGVDGDSTWGHIGYAVLLVLSNRGHLIAGKQATDFSKHCLCNIRPALSW